MKTLRVIQLFPLWALLVAGAATAADTPALLGLQYTADGKALTLGVSSKPGQHASPTPGAAPTKWRVLPGTAIASVQRPADRVVELYRNSKPEPLLVCRIEVRYFRNKQGAWVPHMQLNEIPLVMRDRNGWKPFTSIAGLPGLMVLTSSTLPNAEGYYPWLEFGVSNGSTAVDFWLVR